MRYTEIGEAFAEEIDGAVVKLEVMERVQRILEREHAAGSVLPREAVAALEHLAKNLLPAP